MVLVPGSGFGGSGYKFDKAEEEAIKKDRKQQRKQYSAAVGMEDEVSSSESGEESEADEEGATPAGIVPPKEVDKEKFEKILEDDRSTKSQKEAAQQALAFIKALELKKQLQHVKPPGDPDHFSIEMEINDFSQQARWKVTNKVSVSFIFVFIVDGCYNPNRKLSIRSLNGTTWQSPLVVLSCLQEEIHCQVSVSFILSSRVPQKSGSSGQRENLRRCSKRPNPVLGPELPPHTESITCCNIFHPAGNLKNKKINSNT
eukprot:TRINITY_DN369_c0_g1_i6.p1 TRINITY_DN369_c0_g1~~TRINITY_DN369_c0_g1_i6.p1  ORF type:complete len:273 (+),score=-15.53 TRINITY_DN369_c0_g1_i6:46-819(+)